MHDCKLIEGLFSFMKHTKKVMVEFYLRLHMYDLRQNVFHIYIPFVNSDLIFANVSFIRV